MGEYLGARPAGSVLTFNFNTVVNGVPTTLAGSPSLACYKKNDLTQVTTGLTLTADYDSVTGLNHVQVDLSTDTAFYAGDNDYAIVVAAGTVGGVSAIGYEVAEFSVTIGATNLDKATNAIGRGTCTTGGSTTSIPTSAFSPAGAIADQFKGRVVMFDKDTTTATLRGCVVTISASSNAATPTFTVSALPAAPASGDTFSVV